MDDELDVVEFEVEDLEQVACWIWSDAEALGWFGVAVDGEVAEGGVPGVADLVGSQPVPEGASEPSRQARG